MMNNYEWNQPDNLKRFSMFLSPKGMAPRGGQAPSQPGKRDFTDGVAQSLLSLTFQIHPSAPSLQLL